MHIMLLIANILLIGWAAAQPFKREPLLIPLTFTCDDENFLVASGKDRDCTITAFYAADPTVGLNSLDVTFMEDHEGFKRVKWSEEFSKARGQISVGSFNWPKTSNDAYKNLLGSYPSEKKLRSAHPGPYYLIRVSFPLWVAAKKCSGGCWEVNETLRQIRAKLSFNFANGIKFPREIAIRVVR